MTCHGIAGSSHCHDGVYIFWSLVNRTHFVVAHVFLDYNSVELHCRIPPLCDVIGTSDKIRESGGMYEVYHMIHLLFSVAWTKYICGLSYARPSDTQRNFLPLYRTLWQYVCTLRDIHVLIGRGYNLIYIAGL